MKWIEVAQSCRTLCDPMDCSPLGSSVHGIFQARILEWVAISFSRGSSRPRDWTQVSALQADTLTSEPPGKPRCNTSPLQTQPWITSAQNTVCMLSSVWLFVTLWTVAPPGSSVYGIMQARLLEWVAMPFSRGSSWTRDRTSVSYIAGRLFTHYVT